MDERVYIEYLRWAASDLGWIVGHEYTCYSPLFARYFVKGYLVLGTVTSTGATPPLFARNTSVVYEGKPVGTPDSAQFFRIIEEHKVARSLGFRDQDNINLLLMFSSSPGGRDVHCPDSNPCNPARRSRGCWSFKT